MTYISLFLISTLLTFLELSFLPYFNLFNSGPFLFLPFLALLSVKYKGFSHLVIALIFGLIYDFATIGFFGKFTFLFLLVVIAGRLLFSRNSSYEANQSYLILVFIASLAIYLSELNVLYSLNFFGWQNYIIITAVGLLLTLVYSLILNRILLGYIEWLNRKKDESNRG